MITKNIYGEKNRAFMWWGNAFERISELADNFQRLFLSIIG
jgi:hypothetical protein